MNNIINKIIYTYICIENTRIYIYELKQQTNDKRQSIDSRFAYHY